MAIEWFYTTNKQQMGPVTWNELRELADGGILKPHDMVWSEGMDEWVKAISQQGLFAEDGDAAPTGRPRRKAAYSDAKPPPGRRTRREDDEDEDNEDDERTARRKARKRAEDRARMGTGVKIALILGGAFFALILLASCTGVLVWFSFSARGDAVVGGGPRRETYTVNNLRERNIDERRFTFTAGKRVTITSTNNIQFPNTDVDLRVFRGNNGPFNELPLIADDGLPFDNRNCRVEFVVPETGTYRVRVVNLGPGMANSCTVNIEEQ